MFSWIAEGFNSIIGNLKEGLNSVVDAVTGIATSIVNGIKDLLYELFVPDQDNLQSKIDSIKSHFSFASDLLEREDLIYDLISPTSAPSF